MSVEIGTTLVFIGVYNLIGLLLCSIEGIVKNAYGLEFMRPCWIYSKHTNLNWFGAIMLSLLFHALCPVGAVFYWFYKLCTVGRR